MTPRELEIVAKPAECRTKIERNLFAVLCTRVFPGTDSAGSSKKARTIESSASSTSVTKTNSNALVKYECPPPKPPSSLSIEALLSVPLSVIFRQTNSNNNGIGYKSSTQSNQNFLLSRVEATILLQISQLAHEMDTLTSMTLQALDKSRIVRDLHQSIRRHTTNDGVPTTHDGQHPLYLRAIEPLLRVHGLTIPQQVLQHVQAETERILGNELPSLGRTMQQFSEQNWCVANTLEDTMGGIMGTIGEEEDGDGEEGGSTVRRLAMEKRAVSELEEEVCRRIDGLVRMSHGGGDGGGGGDGQPRFGDEVEEETGDAFETAVDRRTGEFCSMEDFCGELLDTSTALVVRGGGASDDLDDASNGPLEGGSKEIPNVCSSIGVRDDTMSAGVEGHGGVEEATIDGEGQMLKEGCSGRPSLVQSDPNCSAGPLREEHNREDEDDDQHQCNETQALPRATSGSLDDAAAVLGLLSSGKTLDRATSIKSKGLT